MQRERLQWWRRTVIDTRLACLGAWCRCAFGGQARIILGGSCYKRKLLSIGVVDRQRTELAGDWLGRRQGSPCLAAVVGHMHGDVLVDDAATVGGLGVTMAEDDLFV